MPPDEDDQPGGRHGLMMAVLAYFTEHGVGDASLRQIAAGIGSSHRMLLYHFGTREGLLTAVVEAVEESERQTLETVMADRTTEGRVLAWRFWQHSADSIHLVGPLHFELAAQAMRKDDLDAPLRSANTELWEKALTEMWMREGALGRREARAQARLNFAVATGLLHDLLLTGDRRAVDTAMARFDWLVFGTPHPLAEVRALTRQWKPPAAAASEAAEVRRTSGTG
jgi:AcrR family transcriptional regulator